MRKTLFIIFTAFLISNCAQKKCELYTENYIPKNLNESVEFLECEWADNLKNEFKLKPEKEAVSELHHSYGQYLRNQWELWNGNNELSLSFQEIGITHPDDISSIILTSFHRKLNNKNIEIEKQAQFYKDYWKKSESLESLDDSEPVPDELDF